MFPLSAAAPLQVVECGGRMQHYREDNWASISYYVSERCVDKPELTVAARGGSWGVGVQERSDYEVWSAGYGRGDMPISSQELSERNMASSVHRHRKKLC